MKPKLHTTMSEKSAAQYTGLNRIQLQLLAHRGKLTQIPASGGQVRYVLSELNALRRGENNTQRR